MPNLDVSPEAARWIKIFLDQERRDPKKSGFRLGVRGGGCSGMEYAMGMGDPKDGDHVFEKDGIRVFVDPKSMPFVEGSRLHFLLKFQGAGFVVFNPQVASSCGCGTSFAPKTETVSAAVEGGEAPAEGAKTHAPAAH